DQQESRETVVPSRERYVTDRGGYITDQDLEDILVEQQSEYVRDREPEYIQERESGSEYIE
ncbi:MAG: hypothetical protein U9Q75_00965, partial [Pseudomonadota bacterium]|nr:hypothetical protein [Pseudomonadota bacterium]